MQQSEQLSITIPTFNRAEFLDYSLQVHIPIMRKYSIGIYISDNASTDNTQSVVEKWQKVYPHIHYHRNEENLGPDANFEIALKSPTTEYVWLLGDTYKIQEQAISYFFEKITNKKYYDLVILGLPSYKDKKMPPREYVKCNEVFVDLAVLMSAMGCLIYNQRVLEVSDFKRYYCSYYPHTGILLEYIARYKFKLLYLPEFTMSIFSINDKSKDVWSLTNKVFDYGADGWVNFIFSLPPAYTLKDKLSACRSYSRYSGNFTYSSFMKLRARGILNFNTFSRYEFSLKQICGFKYYISFPLSIMPIRLARVLLFLYSYIRKDTHKVKMSAKNTSS